MSLSPASYEYALPAKIVSQEALSVVLELPSLDSADIITFRWPRTHLPPNVMMGDEVVLAMHSKKEAQEDSYVRMRQLLEELIN